MMVAASGQAARGSASGPPAAVSAHPRSVTRMEDGERLLFMVVVVVMVVRVRVGVIGKMMVGARVMCR